MMDIYAYIRRPVTEEDMRFERGLNDLEPEKKRKERAKEEGDVDRCVDEIGGGDDENKLSISNFARFSQRGNTIITILLRREFLICKEENHQSLACDFNFLNLGVKFIWNRKLKICGNDR